MPDLTFPPPPLPAPPPPAAPAGRRRRRRARVGGAGRLALLVSLALVGHALVVEPASSDPGLAPDASAYSFVGVTPDGEPFRWDPCSPIRYEVDLGTMPGSALANVQEAVRLTGQASGLHFEFDGLVEDTSPLHIVDTMDFVSYREDGTAEWNPVLITFAPHEVFHEFHAARALGIAFPVTSRQDYDQLVTGLIVITADVPLEPGFRSAGSLGPVVEHELGHIVGLGHVAHPLQLMFPAPLVRRWNDGDLTGLRRLGSGPCLVVPSAYAPAAAIVPVRS